MLVRYDTIVEFNVDSKAEYSASSTRSQKKKLKQTTPVPVIQYRSVKSGFWGESPLEWRRFGMAALRNGGPQPRRRRLEAFTTNSKIIRLISRRVAIFPSAAARQIYCDAADGKKFPG